MKMHRIALIGFRATGKSSIGILLARDLGYEYLDLDQLVTHRLGQSIAEFVKENGWAAFRLEESRLLNSVLDSNDAVVSTGGGIVLLEKNRKLLRSTCFVVWLEAAPESICSRIQRDPGSTANRPALTALCPDDEVRQLLEEREPLYLETSHQRLRTDNLPPAQAARIIRQIYLEKRENEPPPRY